MKALNQNLSKYLIRYNFTSLNSNEMERFNKLNNWWKPNGPMINFLKKHLKENNDYQYPFKNMKILDVGCGAGFLAESLARLGGQVIAIDPNQKSYLQAINHKSNDPTLQLLEYHNETLENYLKVSSKLEYFDIVTSMQVIQHVDNPQQFVMSLSSSLKNGGLLMLSTISRSYWTWLTHILAAQYITKIVPIGTHDHNKFINPSELSKMLFKANIINHNKLQLSINYTGKLQIKQNGDNYLMIGIKNNHQFIQQKKDHQ